VLCLLGWQLRFFSSVVVVVVAVVNVVVVLVTVKRPKGLRWAFYR
jgi:hypothetical protein